MSAKNGSAALISSTKETTVSAVATGPMGSTVTGALLDATRRARETRSLRRANALVAAGQPEKALAHLRRFTSEVPGATRASLKIASLLKESRRVGEALSVLRTATTVAPNDPAPHEALAELALEIGEWQEAIRHGEELLFLAPRSLVARDILSAAYLQRGLLDNALKMASELAAMDPSDPVHHFKRGVLLQQMGRVGASAEAFLRVLRESDEEDDLTAEANEALEMLDHFQMRQIAILAVEDVPFRLRLRHDPLGAVISKGFRLSPAGISALSRIALEDVSTSAPGWRHHYYN